MIDSLYAIVDAEVADRPLAVAFQALNAGCAMVQLRAKKLDDESFLEIAKRIRSACSHAGVPFVVNDRADIARLVHADGLHLGQDDLSIEEARRVVSDMQIGISTHTLEQAVAAQTQGADLIAFGPVFETRTKENPDPVVGLADARETVCRVRVSAPVGRESAELLPENARRKRVPRP